MSVFTELAMKANVEKARRTAQTFVGKRFGGLVILDVFQRIGRNGKNIRMAHIRCDCGVEKAIKLTQITFHGQQHCGCRQYTGMAIKRIECSRVRLERQYLNKTFGINRVTGLTRRKRGNILCWSAVLTCLHCERSREVFVNELGSSSSCSCVVAARHKQLAEQHIGEQFGRLTVVGVELFPADDGHTRYRMVCKCSCGGETTTMLKMLRYGRVVSCGCVKRETASKRGCAQSNSRTYRDWWMYTGPSGNYRMRSSYELAWAVEADHRKLRWEYEPEAFKLKDGCRYIPDFKVYDDAGDYFVECKGYLTAKAETKLTLFRTAVAPVVVMYQKDLEMFTGLSYEQWLKKYAQCRVAKTKPSAVDSCPVEAKPLSCVTEKVTEAAHVEPVLEGRPV